MAGGEFPKISFCWRGGVFCWWKDTINILIDCSSLNRVKWWEVLLSWLHEFCVLVGLQRVTDHWLLPYLGPLDYHLYVQLDLGGTYIFYKRHSREKKSDKSLKWPLFYVKIWNKFYLFLTLFHIIWKLTKHEQLWHHPWITHLRSPILYHWARRTQWWRRSVMRFIWHTSCILLD